MKNKDKKIKPSIPTATIAYYGPDDKTVTKIVVGIVNGGEVVDMKKWFPKPTADISTDEQTLYEVVQFIKEKGITSTISMKSITGCPHEEGIDYPEGTTCPQCPFWATRNRWS